MLQYICPCYFLSYKILYFLRRALRHRNGRNCSSLAGFRLCVAELNLNCPTIVGQAWESIRSCPLNRAPKAYECLSSPRSCICHLGAVAHSSDRAAQEVRTVFSSQTWVHSILVFHQGRPSTQEESWQWTIYSSGTNYLSRLPKLL